MKQRPLRWCVAIVEAAIVLAAVYFEPTHCVRGDLRGEAFFEGRSTSWWRAELAHWDVIDVYYGTSPSAKIRFFRRKPAMWQEFFVRMRNTEPSAIEPDGPHLLCGDGNARPVLLALEDDPSPDVRKLVAIGLERMPKKN